jgi:hypothetical protein
MRAAAAWWRAGFAAALCASAAAPVAASPEQVAALLAGEWNNNEQVWQQRIDLNDPKVQNKPVLAAHRHHIATPVAGLGPHWLLLQASRGDDQQAADSPWLLRLLPGSDASSVRAEVLRPDEGRRFVDAHRQPELAAALAATAAQAPVVCELLLRAQASGAWAGGPVADRCPAAAWAGEAWQISAGQWRQGSAAAPLVSRKARYFEGWVWFRNAGPGASSEDRDTSFAAKVQIHTEGQRIPILRKDGSLSPWQLELARLTYQNTRQAILKFALLDAATGKSLAYMWANTDATRVGMNLGWFQSGMTLKTERAAYGF